MASRRSTDATRHSRECVAVPNNPRFFQSENAFQMTRKFLLAMIRVLTGTMTLHRHFRNAQKEIL
jgi:hypothetical protein